MRDKAKKMTIGLLVSGIMDDYTEYICKGARRAAKEEHADERLYLVKQKCKKDVAKHH